jgi:VIT1/CCC1 family predicted Fe2+/Mn2+ transporter
MEDEPRPIREEDRLYEERLLREQRLTIRAMLLTVAVCIAPFLALIFGITAALTVLGVGLLFTAWLCWSGANHVGIVSRSRLRIAGGLNFVMALIVFLIVWVRVA